MLEIQLEHIRKAYVREVLKDINLHIVPGSYYAVVGKSGSGKSTLMNILGLLESFDGGTYTFNGEHIISGRDYHKLRLSQIGFIYQSYNLIPTMTCRENILLPTLYARGGAEQFDKLVDRLDIRPLLNQSASLLSGGEKQRVAIARSLILNPALIIADEPTGNLDRENRDLVFSLFEECHLEGRAVVVITHDEDTARQARQIYTLQDGRLL
ncbi:MAG: ABC transporter ATP-binding protein [Clostridia bacterium]|nr:ABC transporter ATP-binding protein [Clostridia bacterium]